MSGRDGSGVELDLQQLNLRDSSRSPMAEQYQPPLGMFRDITAEFIEASEKLAVGQLVQDPQFTLFQAVGALEIMDPKMDSGLLESEYDLFDAWKPRLPEEIIGIMDRLLCNEMAWHLGSALSQTLFASLYIDKLLSSCPIRLQNATFGTPREAAEGHDLIQNVLRPYCIAVVKSCGYANRQTSSEHIYEEEDFVPQTYGIPLLQIVEYKDVDALIDSGLEWLSENKASFSAEIHTALRNRLLLRKALLIDFSKEGESYHNGAKPGWTESLGLIAEVEKDHVLGKDVPNAWSLSVQRKLASSVPPRPLVELPFVEATTTLKQLCTETRDIFKILDYAGATNTMTYFLNFGARRPPPLPFTRSLIQTLFFKDMKVVGKLPVKCILFDDLKELCNPAEELLDPRNSEVEAPQSPAFQIARRMDWFVERVGRAYTDLYRNLCQNRARIRRILCKSVADWDSLQVEAEEIDSELCTIIQEKPVQMQNGPAYAFPLSSWVYHYKLRLMELVTLLGFELEIFPLHEFDGMYWYLQFYLRTRGSHIERMLLFAGNEKKTLSLLNFHLLEAMAMQDLATALVYLYAALGRYGLLGRPKDPLGDEAFRYEGRMKPFLSMGVPEVVPYEFFRQMVDNVDLNTPTLLQYAEEHIADAKKGYRQLTNLDAETARATLCRDWYRAGMQKLLRSCFGVGVAIGIFTREVQAGTAGALVVTLDRSEGYHPSFPVPLIKTKK
ncbi:Mak10-domain-containing protein [Wilcoxina mikolae CBS 423.85]|nr:Mak10-domain-containing protein [Wilcoxina mikolae CBS 423.85]